MKYKLISLDLDGTLVNKRNSISKKSYKSISKYIDLGGKVAIVTGRSINSAIMMARKIESKTGKKIDYISALNGGILFDYKVKKVIVENLINEEIIIKIINMLKEHKEISIVYYTKEGIKKNNVFVSNLGWFWRWLISIRGAKLKTHKKAKDLSSFKLNLISKISSKKFDKILDNISTQLVDEIELSKTAKRLAEITKKNIDKGYSIEMISNLSNVSLNEIIAIGDSNNDVPMFNKVGYSIAINDKRIKQHITKYDRCLNMSTKNAVAYAIDNIVLNNE